MFKCDKCCKEFIYYSFLLRHKNKKKSCDTSKNINKNFDEKIKIFDKKINELENKIDYLNNGSLNDLNKCLFCNKIFINKSNTNRHIILYCPIKKKLCEEKDLFILDKNKIIEDKNKFLENKVNTEINLYKNENKKLKKNILKIIKNKSKNINTNITNVNTINNNNNLIVNINSFGNENVSHITDEEYKKYLSGFFRDF